MADWLPEDIRGGWYRVPADEPPQQTYQDKGAILRFGLDGKYTEYEIEDGRQQESEAGEFTFDGGFLILRGGSTVTYRVNVEHRWHALLESKSDKFWMLRGLFDPRNLATTLRKERVDEIRRMPAKVLVRSPVDGDPDDDVVVFVDEQPDGDSLILGSACLEWESDDQSSAWIGVTPIVDDLKPKAWRAIVREAYLDVYLGGPQPLETVTVQLFTDAPVENKRLEFRYQG